MGRSSKKFSFPIPGRRHIPTTTREDIHPVPGTQSITSSSSPSSFHLSKAQRILGTDSDLNIDSPIRETVADYSWRHVEPRSSGMSISISESTQSTNENESAHESEGEQWDRESGVLPHDQRMHGRPSSTLLGLNFRQDHVIPNDKLRHNDSSSTLKSYYDRQKSPLAISQQTSASSTRDLALRKGFPSVQQQRSPLLNVESSIDRFQDNYREKDMYIQETDMIPEKMRKKPARLDLSRLFPKSRRHGEKSPADSRSLAISPSSMSTNNSRNSSLPPDSSRRKLKKSSSKDSMQSQNNSIRTSRSYEPQYRNPDGTLPDLYDHYEHMPVRAPPMDRIPESSVPDRLAARAKKDALSQSRLEVPSKTSRNQVRNHESPDREPFSWKNVRSSMMVPQFDSSSGASISSRNTKTSKHTASSIRSHSDIKHVSVLSLSDSEGDTSDPDPSRSSRMVQTRNKHSHQYNSAHTSLKPPENRRRPSTKPSNESPARIQSSRKGGERSERGRGRDTKQNLLSVSEAMLQSAQIAGPWPQPPRMNQFESHQEREYRGSTTKAKRTPRQPPSIASMQSHYEPTPPLSPSSMEFRPAPERESRFMAVTKQEEALLEALRQKRARMREEIIEEHETKKTPSPPRIPLRSNSRYSTASTTNTIRTIGGTSTNQRVLLYLDTPHSVSEIVDASEPSPDLSDFLSFGSDDNSTPRNSWAPARNGKMRPDSFVAAAPYARADRYPPATPPSGPRLSAVGSAVGLSNRKHGTSAVRFVDDGKVGNQEYLLEEQESGVIWGM